MKIKELVKEWPPGASGAFDPRGHVFPQDANLPVAEVGPVINEFVGCKCFYTGKPNTFDLMLEDQETAEAVAAVVRQHLGETLLAIGELEVEVREALPQA